MSAGLRGLGGDVKNRVTTAHAPAASCKIFRIDRGVPPVVTWFERLVPRNVEQFDVFEWETLVGVLFHWRHSLSEYGKTRFPHNRSSDRPIVRANGFKLSIFASLLLGGLDNYLQFR